MSGNMAPAITRTLSVVGVGLLCLVPLLGVGDYYLHVLITILLWSFIYTAWSIMGRFGLVSLGHGAFLGIGAYGVTMLWNHYGLTPWLGIPISLALAGVADPLAIEAVAVLRSEGVPIKIDGLTRFDEPIADGIIGPVVDGSIDELMSSATVILDGQPAPGPAAATVLVFETPAAALPLAPRVRAHAALLRRLQTLLDAPHSLE
jgi:hypothetical protein